MIETDNNFQNARLILDITYLKHLWYISYGSIFLAKMSDMIISYLDITRELCSKVCLANSCVISLTTIFCVLPVIDMHGTRVSLDS